ncbi:MAG: tautomerase family protein [Acetobacteraceae bacterium]
MPHVIVKLLAGRTREQKARIAEAVTKAIMTTTGNGEDAVSVAIEDVERKDWTELVYRPEILANWDTLFKKPGYEPL